jgi:hypothetical protein
MAEAAGTEVPRRSVTGASGPAVRTPLRRPRSVRRTTTHDSLRPDGPSGPVTLTARGRDLCTAADGTATVLATARIDAVASSPGNVLQALATDPAEHRLRALVGRRASSGFRHAVDELLPGEAGLGTIRYQLLDDMPTALLVSGYAVLASWHAADAGRPQQRGVPSGHAVPPGGPGGGLPAEALRQVDMCAGWVGDGVMVTGMAAGVPPYFEGPVVAGIVGPEGGDADGWHAHGRLPPGGMRRRRRIDVWLDTDSDGTPVARVESFFRDSYSPWDGGVPAAERVIHEYSVRAVVATETESFLSCAADYGALPWPECPAATASAGRLAGMPVAGLRRRVREEFLGVGTCTHLNDTLRALADVGALIAIAGRC